MKKTMGPSGDVELNGVGAACGQDSDDGIAGGGVRGLTGCRKPQCRKVSEAQKKVWLILNRGFTEGFLGESPLNWVFFKRKIFIFFIWKRGRDGGGSTRARG